MVKRLSIIMVSCVLLCSACGNVGDGTVQGCATSLYGTYTGTKDGLLYASLDQVDDDGELVWQMTISLIEDDPDNPREEPASVADDGVLTSLNPVNALDVTGTLDLDTCEIGDGTWDLFSGNDSGTFTLGPYRAR